MELIQEYYEEKEDKKKIVLSTFFEKKSDKITCYCNNIEPKSHLNLQDIWTIEVAKFSYEYPKVKIIKDLYLIDFAELMQKRTVHLDNMKLKQNVIDTRSAFVSQVIDQANENVFGASTDLVPISNIINLNKLDTEKRKLKHVDDVHKQDLLYYSIIDLVTSSEKQSIFQVFNKVNIAEYKRSYESRFEKDSDIFKKTSFVVQDVEAKSLKVALKEKKAYARTLANAKRLKKVIKCVKVYRYVVADDENKLDGGLMNETEYTFDFIRPLFKQILHNCKIKTRVGEPYLDCAPHEPTDDDRTAVGPKIDMIFFSETFNVTISVCEVTGPFNKSNKNHFLGDRNKIAKNLKYIIRNIKKNTATPDINSFKKLKVYGFQFYLDSLYIYSLQKVSKQYYVFLMEKKLTIPSNHTLLKQSLPSFLANLWSVNSALKDTEEKMNRFFEASDNEYFLSQSDSETSTPLQSPKKKLRH